MGSDAETFGTALMGASVEKTASGEWRWDVWRRDQRGSGVAATKSEALAACEHFWAQVTGELRRARRCS